MGVLTTMSDSGKVELTKLILEREEINKMSPLEKKRYIMLTSMLQDLNILQKCLLFSGNPIASEKPFVSAFRTINFFFLQTLISKTHEMWNFINKNGILDDHSTHSNELKAKCIEVQNFFSNKKVEKIFSFIRNKFGFHYEYKDDVNSLIDEEMKLLNHLEIWLSNDSGNEIFASSNEIILNVIFSEMSTFGFKGDRQELMNKIFDLALSAARILREFSVNYIAEAFSINWLQTEVVEVNVPSISEVHLPLIVKGN